MTQSKEQHEIDRIAEALELYTETVDLPFLHITKEAVTNKGTVNKPKYETVEDYIKSKQEEGKR